MKSRALAAVLAVAWLTAVPGANVIEAQCTDNSTCGLAQYCQKTQGDCDGAGACADKPLICPDVWDPVCGCDGATYVNSCEAAFAGVSVSSEGGCPPPPCAINRDCSSGYFCLKSTGDCLGDGQCSIAPDACLPIWDPVCGCDDITYSNECMANLASVSVAYGGECLTTCSTHGDCLQGEYCDTAHNGCWLTGACRTKPLVCTQEYDPVCGCDEITYDNACYAAFYGVTVFKTGTCGACPDDPSTDCLFSDGVETGDTGRWSRVVGG